MLNFYKSHAFAMPLLRMVQANNHYYDDCYYVNLPTISKQLSNCQSPRYVKSNPLR